MKNSSDYINKSVYKVNLKYARLQNKTEELFFQCLDEERSVEYFIKKLDEIWGNIDHSWFDEQIEEYTEIIHENNLEQLNSQQEEKQAKKGLKTSSKFLLLAGLGLVIANEDKFKDYITKRYKKYSKSPQYKEDKKEYLKLKVSQYDNQIVPYFNKDEKVIRYVQLSTYLAMIQNTNLTKAAWNATLNDGIELGYEYFWIPPHLFSCEHCAKWQGRLLTESEVLEFIDNAEEEQEGDILHPNCKCSLLIYTPLTKLVTQNLSNWEIEEYYNTRQKMNSLTLKKERIITDLRIQQKLGNQDEVDKLNQQRNKVNTQIRVLQDSLPTEEMRKKVIAINR